MNQDVPPEMPPEMSPVPPPPPPPEPMPMQPAQPPRSNNIWLIVGIVLVVLCCCCLLIAAGVYAWNNGDRWLGNGALFLNQLAVVLHGV